MGEPTEQISPLDVDTGILPDEPITLSLARTTETSACPCCGLGVAVHAAFCSKCGHRAYPSPITVGWYRYARFCTFGIDSWYERLARRPVEFAASRPGKCSRLI